MVQAVSPWLSWEGRRGTGGGPGRQGRTQDGKQAYPGSKQSALFSMRSTLLLGAGLAALVALAAPVPLEREGAAVLICASAPRVGGVTTSAG